MSKKAQQDMKMQYYFTEVLREGPNPEQKKKKKVGERNEMFIFPVVWMIKKKWEDWNEYQEIISDNCCLFESLCS